ncbi:MAG: M48 family metalloprotease [Alphaproteobacteria bacterium]|nr:M48 family metalloprotease [Alphaproteobacteria bacterium]
MTQAFVRTLNYPRLTTLLAALSAAALLMGAALAGWWGALLGVLAATLLAGLAFWNAPHMILASCRPSPVDDRTAPRLMGIVRAEAKRARLPLPRVYLSHDAEPNALTAGHGPENAAVAVTTGLCRHLSSAELAGVVAHELAHVRHHDSFFVMVAAVATGALTGLAALLLLLLAGQLVPLGTVAWIIAALPVAGLAALLQMANQRALEFAADHWAASRHGAAGSLARALRRLEGNTEAEAGSLTRRWRELISSHPPTRERIRRLGPSSPIS